MFTTAGFTRLTISVKRGRPAAVVREAVEESSKAWERPVRSNRHAKIKAAKAEKIAVNIKVFAE
jgi:hypothetical protein